MELNPGYALITTDEYKDLIETSIYYEEILLENKELEKKVRDLQKQLLEAKIITYNLEHFNLDELTDVQSLFFPYDKDFIENSDIPLKNIIEFIKNKKEQYKKEAQDEQATLSR